MCHHRDTIRRRAGQSSPSHRTTGRPRRTEKVGNSSRRCGPHSTPSQPLRFCRNPTRRRGKNSPASESTCPGCPFAPARLVLSNLSISSPPHFHHHSHSPSDIPQGLHIQQRARVKSNSDRTENSAVATRTRDRPCIAHSIPAYGAPHQGRVRPSSDKKQQ